jgi:hypothetical protein
MCGDVFYFRSELVNPSKKSKIIYDLGRGKRGKPCVVNVIDYGQTSLENM